MASEAPLGVPTWQVRRMPEKRKPSQPSQRAGRFPRPFLRGQRYRLLHFQPAAERLREAFRLPAAELRSAWLIARTSPAFGARPHGYPSYNPLCATVSLRVRRVNMERLSASYRGNRTCQKEPQESSSKILILGWLVDHWEIRTRSWAPFGEKVTATVQERFAGFGEIERVSLRRDPFLKVVLLSL
jgi:hypothetical protein